MPTQVKKVKTMIKANRSIVIKLIKRVKTITETKKVTRNKVAKNKVTKKVAKMKKATIPMNMININTTSFLYSQYNLLDQLFNINI